MHQHSQVLSRGVHVDALQLPCLVLGALVAVEAKIAQPPELSGLVRVSMANEQLDLRGDLALVRKDLNLGQFQW